MGNKIVNRICYIGKFSILRTEGDPEFLHQLDFIGSLQDESQKRDDYKVWLEAGIADEILCIHASILQEYIELLWSYIQLLKIRSDIFEILYVVIIQK